MANASANRAEVRYIVESVWGTTPATPAMELFRMTGESLVANLDTEVSKEIRSDRNEQDLIKLAQSAGGNLDFELSADSFDDFIEAVMGGTWTANVLVNGVTERSFSVQKKFADVSRFMHFVGSRINTMHVEVGPNKIVTGNFGVMAKSGIPSATEFAGATYPAGATTTPMNGAAGITINTIDAGAIPGGLMNFTMDLNNNMRAQNIVGTEYAGAIVNGKFQVSGDFEAYFADGTLYDKFATSASFALQVRATQAAKSITIDVPAAKFETGEIVAQGTDTDVMFKSTYRGLYHVATLGSVKITRVP